MPTRLHISSFIGLTIGVWLIALWSWKIFKGWYVKRPDLRGTWKVELKSNWVNPETGEKAAPIYGYAVV
ncbi:hypothetical protein [Vibrio paucivorans]